MMNEFRKTGMDACVFPVSVYHSSRGERGVGYGTKLPAPVRYAGVQEKAVVRIDL